MSNKYGRYFRLEYDTGVHYDNVWTYRMACILASRIRERTRVNNLFVVDTRTGQAVSEVIW